MVDCFIRPIRLALFSSKMQNSQRKWHNLRMMDGNCYYCCVKAKFHYTDTDTDPTGPGSPTKSVHVVEYELNSTTRTRHGPDRTRTDPHGLFCGETPLGPCWSGRVRVVEFSDYETLTHHKTKTLHGRPVYKI